MTQSDNITRMTAMHRSSPKKTVTVHHSLRENTGTAGTAAAEI